MVSLDHVQRERQRRLTAANDLPRRVAAALGSSSYSALHAITLSAAGSCIFLLGEVPSFFLKQIAQQVVAEVPGVQEVRNELLVVSPPLRAPTAPLN